MIYSHDKSGLVKGLFGYEGRTSWKSFLCLHQKLLTHTLSLWERFSAYTDWGTPIPSKVLVFILPKTCMNAYYHDNSVLVKILPGYEGRTSWKGLPLTLCLHQKLQTRTPDLWERFWIGMAWGMPVPTQSLVIYVPPDLYECILPW